MGKIDELTNEASAMQKPVSDIAERGGSGAIAQLIQQYCPDGVEYKHLGDICAIKGRIGFRGYTRNDQVKEGEGALSLSPINIQDGRMDYTKGTYITWEKYEESPEIMTYNGDIIFCKTASVGKTALVKDLPCKATINPQLVVLKDIQCNAPFLAYVLEADTIQKKVVSLAGVGSVPNISQKALSDIEIPLPPLPVQEAIVNILDRFAVYAAELQAELQARQQQYNYYRDTLLSFDGRDDVEWVTIDLLFHRKNGYTPSKNNNDYWTGGTIPWFRMEDIRANGRVLTDSIQKIHHSAVKKNGLIKAGSIIVATSATIGEHALVKVDCMTNQRFTCLTVKDEYTHRVDTMFLFYYMFKVDEWCKTHTVQGNFPGVDMSQFPNVLIPLPDIDEQRKIASTLDRFDTLVNDLSQGLPAEIEARQQQYEYYRDQLLTFKRKEA